MSTISISSSQNAQTGKPPPQSRLRKLWRWGSRFLLGLVVLAAFCLWGWPLDIGSLKVSAQPAHDYADALRRINALDTTELEKLSSAGKTETMVHGAKTERAVVLLHGYTNCPQQFHDLGHALFASGYNVLIPRMPHHGLRDRMTAEQARLTAGEVSRYANEALNIAQGLGKHVTVVGLSAGGVAAGWLAQERSDIDKVVLLSPAFGYKTVPTLLTRPAMSLYRLLPNSFSWWDDTLQEKLQPAYVYPRYSTKALAQLLRLGFAVQAEADLRPPAAGAIVVVTNAHDDSVNNAMTAQLVRVWQQHTGGKVRTFEFPENLNLEHDLIDPGSPHQHTALVYPKLLEMIIK